MDRDIEANTKCTWFIQIGYVYGVKEFSLIVKGLHKVKCFNYSHMLCTWSYITEIWMEYMKN
ncbi:hypothetical protein DVH24_025489 [Malus domestica]|uniref:Uncharacterized protein n=1 Tax=Malus domestica TaxID=3750 RepID=A0A498HKD6_MALDO|nr:hypothetical protein DVH24_025489 [Malus domestica]